MLSSDSLRGFQSTHPCGVRLTCSPFQYAMPRFNPRTRVGCDTTATHRDLTSCVSIHAPVWGATGKSTHRRRRQCFNPRTRVGCDDIDSLMLAVEIVSIHAPVWGATNHCDSNDRKYEFQSTHPCGVRLWAIESAMRRGVSIHAPVWGATIWHFYEALQYMRFNPRTRVGCDDLPDFILLTDEVSIHAPVWGATTV